MSSAPGSNRVVLGLYKSLLRVAIKFDRSPAAKALLYRKSPELGTTNGAAGYYSTILNKILTQDSHLYHPRVNGAGFVEIIREESRKVYDAIRPSDQVDAGFAALRKLSYLWSCYSTNISSDDNGKIATSSSSRQNSSVGGSEDIIEEFPADVTLAPTPVAGVILLAHPMLQGPMHRSAILILEHNTKGSYGIIINNVSSRKLRDAVKNLPEDILRTFGDNRVGAGGMIRRVGYMHNVQWVGGTEVPLCKKSLYAGGKIEKAVAYVNYDPSEITEKTEKTDTMDKTDKAADSNTDESATASTITSTEMTSETSLPSSSSSSSPSIPTPPPTVATATAIAETTEELEDRAERLLQKDQRRKQFRFFVGCCLWEQGELESDIAAGYWVPVLTEPDTALEWSFPTTTPIDQMNRNSQHAGESETTSSLDVGDANQVSSEENSNDSKTTSNTHSSTNNDDSSNTNKLSVHGHRHHFLWQALYKKLGDPMSALGTIPSGVSAATVKAADWK